MIPKNFQVIVVGSGPAGSTLALYLAQQNIEVALLEAESSIPIDIRASTFHPPSLEMLNELGVAEDLIEIGLVTSHYQYRDRSSGEVAVFDMGVLKNETKYPFRLQCEQYKYTQLINKKLQEYSNVNVLLGHQVTGFHQDVHDVRVLVKTEDDEKVIQAAYIVGCDGANSQVRRGMALRYQGFTYPENFLVVSSTYDFDKIIPNLSNVNYISDPDEWCVVLRAPELWRVLIPINDGVSEVDCLEEGFIADRLARLTQCDDDVKIAHSTLYRVHQRVAETYRVGRAVLAGDAAHINNPLGGMGMNGGIHDAYNLAEKLTAILKKNASDSLLDLYDKQRRSIATKFIQEHTIRNKKLMEATDAKVRRERQKEYMRIAAKPDLSKEFVRRNSMIDSVREANAIR